MNTNKHPHFHFLPHKLLEQVDDLVQQARLAELVAQLLLIDSVEELDLVAYLFVDIY
ncbi:hypothetical protein [Streptococcus sp. 1001283B150225_161107_H12]|uniref:hypothetical protein n=1 Tax=Streptococcus sp. 1001283B150225_161107_H12 TaxID=2787122 RepID=UPI001896A5B4|nr:hypothetical protein [Streptococcus sp. 1001283B150225_161107_H12]